MIPTTKTPDISVLQTLFTLDSVRGTLVWNHRPSDSFGCECYEPARVAKAWNKRFAGTQAFTATNAFGYRIGRISGKTYLAHRIIWKMMTGIEAVEIDHINGDRSDNRFENLRSVNHQQNCRNLRLRAGNRSGTMGVFWNASRKRWSARIWHNGRPAFLGDFIEKDDAIAARKAAENRYGFHPNCGLVAA